MGTPSSESSSESSLKNTGASSSLSSDSQLPGVAGRTAAPFLVAGAFFADAFFFAGADEEEEEAAALSALSSSSSHLQRRAA